MEPLGLIPPTIRNRASRCRAWLCGPASASWRRPATRLAVVAVACLAGVAALVLVKVAAIAHILVRLADVGGNVNSAGAAGAGAAGAGAAGAASSGPGSGDGGGSRQGGGGDGEKGGESVTSHMVWHVVTDALFNVWEYAGAEGAALYGEVVTGLEAVGTGAEGYLIVQQSPMAAQATSMSGQQVSKYPGCDPQMRDQCEKPGALLPKGHF